VIATKIGRAFHEEIDPAVEFVTNLRERADAGDGECGEPDLEIVMALIARPRLACAGERFRVCA